MKYNEIISILEPHNYILEPKKEEHQNYEYQQTVLFSSIFIPT